MKTLLSFLILAPSLLAFSQEKTWDTFEGTRVLNNHSTDMLYKKDLEFIVAHKFGDIAGSNGGLQNFFGFDNSSDIRIAFEYGVSNNFNIGIGRSKGVNQQNQVVDGYLKYRLLQQEKNGSAISLTYVSSMAVPYRKPSSDSTSSAFYTNNVQRLIFTNQIIAARKFSSKLSLLVNAGYHHRNLVAYDDVNGLWFTGGALRYRFTQTFGVLAEYNHLWNASENTKQKDPLAFGVEFITGGHNFTIVFSNSRGINENLFLSNTYSSWLDGQWRIGFSINRRFKI